MEHYIENLKIIITTYGLRIIIGLALFFIGKWVGKFAAEKTSAYMLKKGVNATLANFSRQILYVVIMICVVICVLQYMGVPTGQFMVVLGSAGLAVGLAMKDTLSNFAAGVLLTTIRPFNVGDYVEAGGKSGTVVEVQLLNTILNTPDNIRVCVPNGNIISNDISNYTVNGKRRIVINVGVSYDADLQKVSRVLMDVIKSDERILEDPAPVVAVTEFADSSINVVVRPWARNDVFWDVYFDLHKKIKSAFDENEITIPFPQLVVHKEDDQ